MKNGSHSQQSQWSGDPKKRGGGQLKSPHRYWLPHPLSSFRFQKVF